MDEPQPNGSRQFWSRVFLIVFFGLALLLSVTTILGTWRNLDEETETPPATTDAPATQQ